MTRPMPYTSGADKKANGPNAINVRAIQTTNTGISGAVADTILDGFFQRRNSNPRSLRRCAFKESEMKQIPLTRGQFAIVDDIDFSRVSIFKWYATKTGRHYYAKRSSSRATGHNIVSLHRFILDAPKGLIVDHIDGDGLNCQRSNLRMCTVAQNIQHRVVLNRNNTSGVRGVSWDRRRNKWAANINVSGKHKFLGYFTSLEIAATTVHTAILIHHGEYASERDLK